MRSGACAGHEPLLLFGVGVGPNAVPVTIDLYLSSDVAGHDHRPYVAFGAVGDKYSVFDRRVEDVCLPVPADPNPNDSLAEDSRQSGRTMGKSVAHRGSFFRRELPTDVLQHD